MNCARTIVRVVTAWENTAAIIDSSITVVVQRLNISTTTDLSRQAVVETDSTTTSVSSR